MNTRSEPHRLHSEAQRRARIDLAACHRLAYRFGYSEGIDNHLTMLVPGYSDRFYLAPFGLLWAEVRARDLLEVDFQGRRVAGEGRVEDTALYIHLSVHRLKPDARCVLHTHMPHATALGMLQDGTLQMASQSAVGFYAQVAYADYQGLALDYSEGERMVRAMGTAPVLMLRNHGVLVTGDSAAEAFERLYFLERACQVQLLARASGAPLQLIPESIVRATAAQFASALQVEGAARTELHFAALKRQLERTDPDYAQ
ncbi:MAG: aldolase [Gammaproteobacteria bacterium]|nr:aldolase [Gammaproteobacteria bacterium]